jgi:HK97 gp10 family phage protein
MGRSTVTMKLIGFDALNAAIKRAPDVVKNHSSSAIASSTFAVFQGMRGRVPVDTGGLKLAIDHKVPARGGLTGSVVINPGAYYWHMVEFGTVNMAAQPYIRPSAEAESDDFVRRMKDVGPKLERDFTTGRYA